MQTGSNLEAQLDAYEESSAGGARAAGKKGKRNWPVYAAAAGSGLALTTSVGADIIYSGPQNVTASIQGNGGSSNAAKAITIDGIQFRLSVAHAAYQPSAASSLHSFKGRASLVRLGSGGVLQMGTPNVKFLASGAKISGAAGSFGVGNALFAKLHTAYGANNQNGSWPAGQTGFAGITLRPVGGGTDFGWIRLKWSGTNVPSQGGLFPNKITAIDWAYNTTSGAPINAGQEHGGTGVVPEPNTIPLCLLASGSAGVLAWRKWRRQGASATPQAADGGEALN